MKTKPITLEIEKETWEKLKEKTPRTIKLNDKLVSLIEKEVSQND